MVLWTIIIIVCILLFQLYVTFQRRRNDIKKDLFLGKPRTAEDVGAFYDEHHDAFLKVYGEVIQAFRTTDVTKLLDYQIDSIGIRADHRYLDAGCGVCGPSIYFARKTGAKIEGITISSRQAERAKQLIEKENLQNLVSVKVGDFHQLEDYFEVDSFDAIYFLESFGHCIDHEKTINSAWGILKPGGVLYMKDLFKKVSPMVTLEPRIDAEIANINKAYLYNIADLNSILDLLRKKGFIVSLVKTVDINLEDFENLTISNDFQELTGINRIEDLKKYVFPVDFFEIKCIKPWYDLTLGNSRYFLQNLFYLQVHNRRTQDL